VQVTGTDSCLNVRIQPSLAPAVPGGDSSTAVVNCLPDGFIARLGYGVNLTSQEMPVNADGHWWWYLLGQGWAAEDWLAFHHEGDMPYPARPELTNAGLIAYIGLDQGVWLMNADGSGQRLISARRNTNENLSQLQWSPQGNLISFTYQEHGYPVPLVGTRIIDTSGAVVSELPGLVEATWSPDGTRLSAIRFSSYGGLSGYTGTPVVFTLANGAETPLGPTHGYMSAPAWSPDGRQLAYSCVSSTFGESQPDGTIVEKRIDCDGDGLRLVTADGVHARVLIPFGSETTPYFNNPSWSPDGRTIAVYIVGNSDTGCRGYRTVDVTTGALSSCIPQPPTSGAGYGCGGNAETGASDWSPDGRYLAYHSRFGAGKNGVFMRDVATGATHVIPNNGASSASFSSDGAHLTFEGSGFIWVVDADGSGLAILTGGAAPAWQPR
jgi:Tol biopolymer transport system component